MALREECRRARNASVGTPNPPSAITLSGGDSLRSLVITNPPLMLPPLPLPSVLSLAPLPSSSRGPSIDASLLVLRAEIALKNMMEELNKRISDLEERIAKEESDKLIIVREEKEARNAAEKVCKEKSAELERIQDKKSAAERMGEVFCQEATMQTWRCPFSSDIGDNVEVVVPPLAESIADGTLAKFLKSYNDTSNGCN
ncbi:hypothetical protein HN51_013109 [Arachis hypogaea]